MNKKKLVIGAVAATTLLAGGLAVAHSAGYGPGYGPSNCGGPGMYGQMGPGMQGQYGPGPHGPMGPGMHGPRGPGWRGGPQFGTFDPAKLDSLKSELGITAAQEQAWTKYTKTVQDAATAMMTARTDVTKKAEEAALARFAAQTKMREEAQKQFTTMKTAANDLLSTLTDTQKAKAQQSLPGLAFGLGAWHAGPGWHHPRW